MVTINTAGDMAGLFFGTFIVELILLGVAIGLILWKRIKVAEFLYNVQLPKLTELPRFILRRWRPPTTPPPELVQCNNSKYSSLLALYPGHFQLFSVTHRRAKTGWGLGPGKEAIMLVIYVCHCVCCFGFHGSLL